MGQDCAELECQGKAYGVYLEYDGEPLKIIEQGREMIKLVCSQFLFFENIQFFLADNYVQPRLKPKLLSEAAANLAVLPDCSPCPESS